MTTQPSDDIRAAVTGVVHHIDHKRWPELRAVFADQVTTDYTSLFGGEAQTQASDALIAAWRGLLTPIVTQHLLGPIDVHITGERATATCHVRGYHYAATAPGGPEWMVAGHYVFELGAAGGTWKVTKLTLETFYQTGNKKLLEEAAPK